MKKLVTSAMALIAGLVLADGTGVQSANTVGFVSIDAESEVYTPVAVMFGDVGQNTLSIGNIVFDGIYRNDSLQIFGDDGNVATELVYGRDGWQDDEGEDATDWVFQPGDSFWVSPNRGDITVTFPGEVKNTALTVTAEAEVYTPFGNGTPAPVCIADITFDGIYRNDSLQIFGNDGNVATELVYGRDGWQDDEGEDATDWVFQPGDAFWISPNRGDVVVTIPAAL